MAAALGTYRVEGGKIVEPRVAVGGAEAQSAAHRRSRARARRRRSGRQSLPRRRRSGDRRGRSHGGHHHQRRVPPRPRAGGDAPRAGTRGGMNAADRAEDSRGSANRSSGWKTRRLSPAAASLPATSIFRISFTCASCARRMPTAASCRSMPRRRARCRACSRCGPPPTSPKCRRSISARAAFRRSIPIASRSWPTDACAMSANRSPRCLPTIHTWPRTPPISSRWRSTNCRRCSTRRRAPFEFSPGHSSEAGDHPPGLRRRRCRVPHRAACGRA